MQNAHNLRRSSEPDYGLEPAFNLMRRLRAIGWYGTLEFRYQSGGIQQVLQHTSLKMGALVNNSAQVENHIDDDSRLDS